MSVTRSADYPVEIAALFQAFNRCSEGYTADQVTDAAANLLIAAIGFRAKGSGQSLAEALETAGRIGVVLTKQVEAQWDRPARADDIKVPLHGD